MAKIEWEEALSLERDVSILIREQERNGIYFDLGKAYYFISLLERMKEEKYALIRPHLSYEVIIKETKNNREESEYEYNFVRSPRLKNGSYNASVINWYDDPTVVDGPFSRVSIEEPSISKRGLIINQLLRYGWKPDLFTEKGYPKLTEKGEPVDTLEQVGSFGKDLSLWYVYNHRQSQIRGFIPHVDGRSRIAAQMNTCGTNTFRAAHKVVANIPRPTSVFGKEMRSLFSVETGRKFVGADLSGLEARVLAHHMGDEEYISVILSGDIHLYHLSKTQNYILKKGVVDLSDIKGEKKRLAEERDIIKTWFYGFIFGSGDAKSGKIIGGSARDGKKLKDAFFEEIPSLAKLQDRVKSFAKRHGWLPAIDGRKIYVRSFEGRVLEHTALNCLLQANGSIIAKRAMLIANKEVKRRGLDAFQILFYHDEFAYDSAEDCAEEVGKILIDSMRLAGEYYNLKIPIAGEYGIGSDWGIH